MKNIIMSVVFLIALVTGGYFYDKNAKAVVGGAVAVPAAVSEKPPGQSTGSLQRIVDNGVVHVVVQNPSKPFYSSDGSRPKGFNVDFMKILFDQSEFKGSIKVDTSTNVNSYEDVPQELLSNKTVDIAIDGLTFNDDDLPGVVYTIPYVKDFGYSLIAAQGQVINSVADLAGGKLGVLKGDPDARAFAETAFPGVKIVELSDKADADGKWIVGHIKSKTVDAVMYDYPFAVAEVAGTDLQFVMTKIKGSDIQYRIGVRKGDKELLVALNSAIRKAMDTPEYPEMLKTYFMSDKTAAVRRASSGEVSYIVLKGDTLSTIAQAQLGNKMRYADIQSRNNLANPNFIAVGQKLVLPK